jgi:hypothetical protein
MPQARVDEIASYFAWLKRGGEPFTGELPTESDVAEIVARYQASLVLVEDAIDAYWDSRVAPFTAPVYRGLLTRYNVLLGKDEQQGCEEAIRAALLSGEREPATLDAIAAEVREWQDATFTEATPASCAAHLRSEVTELLADPTDAEEIADCAMLVIGVANKAGVDLASAIAAKLAVNRARKWGKRNAEGFVEHERPALSGGEPEAKGAEEISEVFRSTYACRPAGSICTGCGGKWPDCSCPRFAAPLPRTEGERLQSWLTVPESQAKFDEDTLYPANPHYPGWYWLGEAKAQRAAREEAERERRAAEFKLENALFTIGTHSECIDQLAGKLTDSEGLRLATQRGCDEALAEVSRLTRQVQEAVTLAKAMRQAVLDYGNQAHPPSGEVDQHEAVFAWLRLIQATAALAALSPTEEAR